MTDDPHRGSEEVWFGPALEEAQSAVVLIHGRGDSSRGILGLAPEFRAPRTAFLAPQAADFSWYPYSFLSEAELNEPWLSSALDRVKVAVTTVTMVVPEERVVLMGFSQGACLALEFAARNTRRYGGVVAFSGGLIGPDGTPRDYSGSLDGTPVFLGCSDVDAHIPVAIGGRRCRACRGRGCDRALSRRARYHPGTDRPIPYLSEVDAARR